jgi:hypothetical protein
VRQVDYEHGTWDQCGERRAPNASSPAIARGGGRGFDRTRRLVWQRLLCRISWLCWLAGHNRNLSELKPVRRVRDMLGYCHRNYSRQLDKKVFNGRVR